MAQLNVYLSFKGNCKEAMDFYHNCLGGDLSMTTVGDSPIADKMPPEEKNNIMHSTLKNNDILIMASDMMGPEDAVHGNTMSLCLIGKDKADLEGLFSKLSEGGKITTPLREEFFGTYGDITDKFGIRWMFQADPVSKD